VSVQTNSTTDVNHLDFRIVYQSITSSILNVRGLDWWERGELMCSSLVPRDSDHILLQRQISPDPISMFANQAHSSSPWLWFERFDPSQNQHYLSFWELFLKKMPLGEVLKIGTYIEYSRNLKKTAWFSSYVKCSSGLRSPAILLMNWFATINKRFFLVVSSRKHLLVLVDLVGSEAFPE